MSMPEQTPTDSCTAERVMIRTSVLARELGVAPGTLRLWERQGHIPRADRSPLGTRVWDRAAVHAAARRGWWGRRSGPDVPLPSEAERPYAAAPRGQAVLPPRPQPEHAREHDHLGAIIAKVAARAADKAVKEWLRHLLERGERASGVMNAADAAAKNESGS